MHPIFTAQVEGQNLVVKDFTKEGIYFSTPVSEPGRDVSIAFCANADGVALEILTQGEVKQNDKGSYVAARFTPAQNLALKTLFGVDETKSVDVAKVLAGTHEIETKPFRTQTILHFMALAVLSLSLIGTIAALQYQKTAVISAPAAFVDSSGVTLESNVSGKVEYIAKGDYIQVGEIFAAVRTESGRSIYLESGKSGNLVGTGVGPGNHVRKGDKIFKITNVNDTYFVNAYVSYADVVKITSGYKAEIDFGGASNAHMFLPQIIQSSNITAYQQFHDEAGNPLIQVRLNLPDDTNAKSVGKTVNVEFHKQKSMFSELALPFSVENLTLLLIGPGRSK